MPLPSLRNDNAILQSIESPVVRTSLFDLFKIGIGPSSSHTVGPMRAALEFAETLAKLPGAEQIVRVQAELYGSLALTGHGHATDRAVLLGLSGERPDTIDPAEIDPMLHEIRTTGRIALGSVAAIGFNEATDLLFHRDQMFPPGTHSSGSEPPSTRQHPNGMRFTAFDASGNVLLQQIYYSIGGGFVVRDDSHSGRERAAAESSHDVPPVTRPAAAVPYPFGSAAELLAICEREGLTIAELMRANETSAAGGDTQRVADGIARLWGAMEQCCCRGMETSGTLPGGLNVRRRACRLAERLREKAASGAPSDPLAPLDWVSVYAMAVNEENAAGGRVVTAPTNGAAGVIPAVGHYYFHHLAPALSADERTSGIQRFLLTAAAIGILYKENASISGAEVGCQGEVGVACSMAAGGLVAALGGSNREVEHAAEIGMEHNLGMTCDPIGGLVQIPCIERNAIGAVKAVQACRLAMNEPEEHKVSLDQVIETMYRTGLDMQSRYKETSLAGLALNVIEC